MIFFILKLTSSIVTLIKSYGDKSKKFTGGLGLPLITCNQCYIHLYAYVNIRLTSTHVYDIRKRSTIIDLALNFSGHI